MSQSPLVLSVATLGRVEALRRLLSSLPTQLSEGDRVVLVAQDHVAEVRALADEFAEPLAGRLRVTTSARGASLGRNTGVREAASDLDDALLMFPNDTTWFPPGSLAAIRAEMAAAPAGAVTVVTASGPRFTLPERGSRLDPDTVWKVIEMGLVIRLDLFRRLGGFDESIGTGAAAPWQAGEVTDLLMRARRLEPLLDRSFVWIPQQRATVGGIEETAGLSTRERRRKLRAYGRGVGFVFRSHDFPQWHRLRFVVAGLFIGVLRPHEYSLVDGLTAFAGRLEGLLGRTFRDPAWLAVER